MKSVALAFCCVLVVATSARAQSDIFGGITQAAVDRVIRDAKYPVTLVRQDTLHYKKAKAFREIALGSDKIQAMVAGCVGSETSIPCALKNERNEITKAVARAKTLRKKAGEQWSGEDDAQIEKQAFDCFKSKIVVSHLQVNLLDAPGMKISGASIAVSDVHLDTDVTVQLWSKTPEWVCDKQCPIIGCCSGHFTCSDFHLISQVIVRDIKTTTSATVALATAGPKVLGTPTLTKLLVHLPFFGDVDLTELVNLFLKPKQVTVYNASQLVASFPMLNTSYHVKSISLSGTSELRVDVAIEKGAPTLKRQP